MKKVVSVLLTLGLTVSSGWAVGSADSGGAEMARAQSAFDEANAAKDPKHSGYAEAYSIWSRLAEHGNDEAKYHLGILHLYGLGGATFDHIYGYQLIQESAYAGYARAEAYVGVMHEKGSGLFFRKGDAEARGWYEKAAGSGNCYAVRRLSRAQAQGELGFVLDTVTAESYRVRHPSCFD